MQLVIDNIPDLLSLNIDNKLYSDLLNIKGIQDTTAQKILNALPQFKSFLLEIPDVKILESNIIQVSGTIAAFNGIRVIFTGIRDKDIENIIVASGGEVSSTVSKTHTYQIVVAKDPTKISNKLKDAIELKVPIMTLENFKKKFKV
jgi:NAD-dependent DNA ligase